MRSIKEAVAVFENVAQMQAAIDELESSGFDRSEISLLASTEAVEKKLGHKYRKVSELEDNADVPRKAYVSTESIGDAEGALIGGLFYVGAVAAIGAVVASGGTVLAALAAAAVYGGTGGLIGGILAQLVGEHHAGYLQEQLDRGGLILWVHARDDAHASRATGILKHHSAHDVHLHELPPATV